MFPSLLGLELQGGAEPQTVATERTETTLSRKRSASPGGLFPHTTIAEVPEGCPFTQKRHQTSHNGLACGLHTAEGHQEQDELTTWSTRITDGPLEQFEVTAGAYCTTFQQDQMDLEHAVNSWLEPGYSNTQTDGPQATHFPHAMAHPRPLPCFSADPALFGTGWAPLPGPTPGSIDPVYQFQGSARGSAGPQQGSSNDTQAGCKSTSQLRVRSDTAGHPMMTYQETQAVEVTKHAKHAPLIMRVAQGQNPFAHEGSDQAPIPTARPVGPGPLGWTARYGIDEEDDYDSDLQAALAASVTEQNMSKATNPTPLDGVPSDGKGPTVCPRAVPRRVLAEEAAKVEEISRLTAEPLFVRAQNGVGGVWQNEKDPSVPRREPPTEPEGPTQGSMPGSFTTAAHAEADTESVPAALKSQATNLLVGDSPPQGCCTPETCAEKVAELTLEAEPADLQLVGGSLAADSLLGGSPTPEACAEKVAELTLEDEPAGLQLVGDSAAPNSPLGGSPASDSRAEKVAELDLNAQLRLAFDHGGVSEDELLSLEKLLGERELQVQLRAYGPESGLRYISDDLCGGLCDDLCDDGMDEVDGSGGSGGSEASDGAVSDSCSEEQEDFDAARKAVGKAAVGKKARSKKAYSFWRSCFI